jgi:hypothetical protein
MVILKESLIIETWHSGFNKEWVCIQPVNFLILVITQE